MRRAVQQLGLLLLLLCCQLQPAIAREPGAWPVVGEDGIRPDPRAVWGRLPSGMRWVVLPNQTPPGHVSLRLMIEAGSLMERDDQRGLAHFLEHMAFKGSENIRPGEMVTTLSRLGLAFGADTNASTGFEETIYKLELPRNDREILDTGLFMLAEIAHKLTLLPEQIEPERGVIASERRLRNTPGQRAFEASLRFQFPGSRLVERFPIGQEEVIATAPRALFEQFYRTWYVPSRTVVAVVGDVEPEAARALIEGHFGSFAAAPEPTEPDPGDITPGGLRTMAHVDRGLPATLTVTMQRPFVERQESLAEWRRVTAEQLASTIIDRRLEAIAAAAGAPFRTTSVGTVRWRDLAEVAMVRLGVVPERWEDALRTVAVELERARLYGFGEEERRQAVAVMRGRYEEKAATATTTDSRQLVGEVLYAVGEEAVFTSAETDIALFDRVVAEIDTAMLTETAKRLFAGTAPLIELSGPIEVADAPARIAAVWAEGLALPVAAPEAQTAATFAYEDFGPAGQVVAERRAEDLGILSRDFANGVALDMKATDFARDTVSVLFRFGHGRAALPADLPGVDLLARWAFERGGLGRHDRLAIERIFAGRRMQWQLIVADGALAMSAETSREDLPDMLRLLTAYLTDPGYRPEALDDYRQRLDESYRRLAASAQGPIATVVQQVIHGGDPRFGLPPQDAAAARTMADLRAWLGPQLAAGPLQVAIVGDIDPEATTALVAKTVGALPPRPALAPVTAPPPRFPTDLSPLALEHFGPAGQATVLAFWPTRDSRDQRLDQGLELLADVFQDRLLHEVREQAGATYSPNASHDGSLAFPEYGYMSVNLDVAADNATAMQTLVGGVAHALATVGVSPDELVRAQEPRIARAIVSRRENSYWLFRVLGGMRQFPDRLDAARRLEADIRSIDKPFLDELARTYLPAERALLVLILPHQG